MYHTIEEFLKDWETESALTLKVFKNISDESLSKQIPGYRRTTGTLAWHITGAMGEMMRSAGYPIDASEESLPEPTEAAKIADEYEKASKSLVAMIRSEWTNDSLGDRINMYGEMWTKEFVLRVLLTHQIHHRAQLTVVMRLNGLKVPGIYGPSYEEWQQYNMEPQK